MAGRCYGIPRPQSSRPPCSNCSADRTTHPSRTRGPARATNILARTPCKPGGRVEWSGTSEETTLLMSVQDGGGWARDPIRAAGGRRRYNADRQIRARLRQVEVVKLLLACGHSRPSIISAAKHGRAVPAGRYRSSTARPSPRTVAVRRRGDESPAVHAGHPGPEVGQGHPRRAVAAGPRRRRRVAPPFRAAQLPQELSGVAEAVAWRSSGSWGNWGANRDDRSEQHAASTGAVAEGQGPPSATTLA